MQDSHRIATAIASAISSLVLVSRALGSAAARAADPSGDPVAAAEAAYGHTMGWFFDQWLGRLGRPSGLLAAMYLLNAIPE